VKQGNIRVSNSRYLAAAFAIALMLICPVWFSHAQQKRPAPPPPNPAPQTNPFGSFGEALKQKAAETTISTLLNNDLPLKLDANAVYPTVAAPPGGPFAPTPLKLSMADLDRPLPPGDYTIDMLAFCTEYSVHRPGAGVAYRLGPLQGKAAGAIRDLLWRGTLRNNLPPQQLQAISWGIQSGLRYDQMPKTYQSVIDNVIPDHRNELNGDFFQSMEDSYNNLAKGTKLPPLQQLLGGMGKSGQLALSADRQRQALLKQNITDQIKDQTLFAGQDSGVYTPVRAEEGPWTERIPGVAYLRYQIVGGNLARNNTMQIRIMPQAGGGQRAGAPMPRSNYGGFLAKPASYASAVAPPAPQTETPPATSPQSLIGGSIGCAVGQGAQCLIPVPATTECITSSAGHVEQIQGQVQINRGSNLISLKSGDQICRNDQITTGSGSHALVKFADDTEITLSEKTSLKVDNYVYDPSNHPAFIISWAEGAFRYLGTKVAPPKSTVRIETAFGTIGIRGEVPDTAPRIFARNYISGPTVEAISFPLKRSFGSLNSPVPSTPEPQNSSAMASEFIASYDAASGIAEIDLIEGQLHVTSKATATETPFTGPVKITMKSSSTSGSTLTWVEYDAVNARLFSSQGAGVPDL
jgi:hypothetical protein